jgi:hypothetical protein
MDAAINGGRGISNTDEDRVSVAGAARPEFGHGSTTPVERRVATAMKISLPRTDGSLKTLTLKAAPLKPEGTRMPFNRTVYAHAHVIVDPFATVDPWDRSPAIDWDATLAFREHLYGLGFKVSEATDTAQRGMGLDWPEASELIRRSLRHARSLGADVVCGVGTDQLQARPGVTLAQVEAAYRAQMEVVEAEGGRAILMPSRALARCATSARDYLAVYGRILREARQPVVIHWLGSMLDPRLEGYWGSNNIAAAQATLLELVEQHADKIEGVKISLMDSPLETSVRRRLPPGVKMFAGDDFDYAEKIQGDGSSFSHGLLAIFGAIAPVAALAEGRTAEFRAILDPTLALARELFRAPTRHYKVGIVLLAWLNGHQRHFSMLGGLQGARGAVHYAKVFEYADACGALSDPELAVDRMRKLLAVSCGIDA